MLTSDDLCLERGPPGLVFAGVFNLSEMWKIPTAQPRGKRLPRTPGAVLTI